MIVTLGGTCPGGSFPGGSCPGSSYPVVVVLEDNCLGGI